MSRRVAVFWHASFSIAAGVLYFFFVLPRWPELTGDTGHTLGTAMRIVTGALIGLAALQKPAALFESGARLISLRWQQRERRAAHCGSCSRTLRCGL